MKSKYLALFLLTMVFLYSCDVKSSKETKPTVEKETPKKPEKKEAPFVYGIDISQYQGNEIDLLNSKKDSIGFIICKATQGSFYVDPRFAKNWSSIKEKGFIRGTYHFYMSNNDPIKQAEHFANTINSIEDTDIPPIVDFEMGGIDSKQAIEEVAKGLTLFIETLEKKLGRKPMIYTDIPTADKYLRDEAFASYPLWVANYVKKPQPDLPFTWRNAGWTFWQRNSDYKIGSINNDFDIYNGDISKLKDFIKNY